MWKSIANVLVTWSLALGLVACGGGSSTAPSPVISVQPTDTAVALGAVATLAVSASGTGLTYQWQGSSDGGVTWSDIPGATQTPYTTPVTTLADNGKRFRVFVSASGVTVASSAVQLTVTAVIVAPNLTVQPTGQATTAPATATFSVTAGGTTLEYQWQRSIDNAATWTNLSGATAASYTTAATDLTMNGERYRVLVSNSAGSVTSAAVALTVNAAPVAAAIATQPTDQSVTSGSAAVFTVVASGTPAPTLQWQRSGDNGASWVDIVAAIGATCNTGLTTLSQSGERYRAVASNSAGSASSNAALLTVNAAAQAPAVTTQPKSQSVTEPSSATFSGAASGVPTPTWQWQLSSDAGNTWANINGATAASYATGATSVADSGRQYRLVASNSAGNVTSNAATLTATAAVPAPSLPAATGKLAAADRHTCAVKADNTLACWGYNSSGQLGSGTGFDFYEPNPVVGLSNVSSVAAGWQSSCAIHGGDSLSCWGKTPGLPLALTPTLVATHALAVTVGGAHKCYLSSGGQVFCWGDNSEGMLGDGTFTFSTTPVPVGGVTKLSGVAAIAAGGLHTCALRSNGTVVCWGSNGSGQLGNGGTTRSELPVPVGLSGVVAISAGTTHTCALLADASVQCWGDNAQQQLGDGTTASRSIPGPVAGLSNITSVATGDTASCAVRSDGQAFCWGKMGTGLGIGLNSATPLAIPGLGSVAVMAGGLHMCALLSSGAMRCWGSNPNGALGHGDNVPRATPVDVIGGTIFWR